VAQDLAGGVRSLRQTCREQARPAWLPTTLPTALRHQLAAPWAIVPLAVPQARSKRSSSMTLVHAATKSWTNFFRASALP